jgi:hypothetical protein
MARVRDMNTQNSWRERERFEYVLVITLVCTDKIPSVLKTHYIIGNNLLRLFCV